MGNVKIITINTWKCDGNYRERMELLAEQLGLLKPAVIACQECFVCKTADTLKFLSAKLGMNYLFAPGREKNRYFEGKWITSLSGLGILSIYPLKEYDIFTLPAIADDEDRKAQQAVISLPSGELLLLTNIHLTHLCDSQLRKAQANLVAERVIAATGDYIKIVCGDFNAGVNSDEVMTFVSRSDAIDAYTAGNGVEPRCSLAIDYEGEKNNCVDHIFALLNKNGQYPQFISSEIVLNKPGGNSVYPSDHFGISTILVTEQNGI